MRLSDEYAAAIRAGVRKIFGPNARVWLFGSRTDDSRRGGDIDLYVEAPCASDEVTQLEGRLYAFLVRRLGEQRIDIIVRPNNMPPRSIDEEAKRTGVRL
ncbi:nucleotidyltransferase domain-containing protein [Ectothiorhodospiraceae bacterium WFHF3C12]|nr:nucleotidyltransferase domain-containing protein [Ectothiorhodospiraceae bacterium WFHF3C12]